MSQHLTVTAANGVTFNVTFGRRLPKYHRSPVVTFYDSRHGEPGTLGQLVADYYAETIAESVGGLDLMGNVDAWTVDAGTMDQIRDWVRQQPANPNL